MRLSAKQSGFTLVEIIIYMAIIGMVASSFVGYILSVYKLRNKQYVISETAANVRNLDNLLQYYIRNSAVLYRPAKQSTSTVLEFRLRGASASTTIYSLSGFVYAQTGASTTPLTTNESYVSHLLFTNRGATDTVDMLVASGTVKSFSSTSIEYYYEDNFQFNVTRPF